MRILMVDDEFPEFLLDAIAEDMGVRIDLARTEEQAREQFFRKPPADLVLMDGYLLGRRNDDTTLLVRWFRRQGYLGPMMAISGDSKVSERLVLAGCTQAWKKTEVVPLLKQWIAEHS